MIDQDFGWFFAFLAVIASAALVLPMVEAALGLVADLMTSRPGSGMEQDHKNVPEPVHASRRSPSGENAEAAASRLADMMRKRSE